SAERPNRSFSYAAISAEPTTLPTRRPEPDLKSLNNETPGPYCLLTVPGRSSTPRMPIPTAGQVQRPG
ncbi:hypothetical protein FS749_006114, partial [Ceratobasidium sp. UAMH 11750]